MALRKRRSVHTLAHPEPLCGATPPSSQIIEALEAAILELLNHRGPGKTICPSEAARQVAGTESNQPWEVLMEPVRTAASRLCASGQIAITQQGQPVDLTTAKGPIRLRLR